MAGETNVPPHVHVDVGIGHHKQMSRVMLSNGVIQPDRELLYEMVNYEMFKTKPLITTHYMEASYRRKFGVDHPGLDVVPLNRRQTSANFDTYWSLDHEFVVHDIGRYWDGTTYMILWIDIEEDRMKLDHQWQWDMLEKTFDNLERKGILSSSEWRDKAKNKTLTNSEAAFLSLVTLDRITDREVK